MQVVSGVIFPETINEAASWLRKRFPASRHSDVNAAQRLGAHMGSILSLDPSYSKGFEGVKNPFAADEKLAETFKKAFCNAYSKHY